MYIGSGLIIEAPETGKPVMLVPLSRWPASIVVMRRIVGSQLHERDFTGVSVGTPSTNAWDTYGERGGPAPSWHQETPQNHLLGSELVAMSEEIII